MTTYARNPAFSLVELLAAMAIVTVLGALVFSASRQTMAGARKSDSLARLRSWGNAVLTYAGEHDARLPGPLWPGQVLLYDAAETGRLVVRLAPYLDVEHRESPYVAERLLPTAFRTQAPGGPLGELRVYVVNSVIVSDGQTNRPFGSLTSSPATDAMRLAQLPTAPPDERWMLSETDQRHPDVSGAPWKASTPAAPLHGDFRAAVDFDGSARLERAP